MAEEEGKKSGAASASGASPDNGGRRLKDAIVKGGWRRFAKLWGFLGFCVLVLVLARHVVLPFVFALLIAYILSPLVKRMSTAADGSKRMPEGVAILLCYIVFLSVVAAFFLLLMPRLSKDVARIGKEAPALYKKLNNVWAPQAAEWLEERFPSLKAQEPASDEPAVVPDVPLPPGTQFVLTPLPDGRMAVQLEPSGVELTPTSDGGYAIAPRSQAPQTQGIEGKLRVWAKGLVSGLQGQVGGAVRAGQKIIAGIVGGIFKFFLVLMIAAFIMLDIDKIHHFVRSLFPARFRDDYDVIVAGIDRGLSGVIRGQLIICLVNGVLTYVGLLIFDIKYSLILAVVAAVMSLIPIFGSILSTIPMVLVAMVSGDQGIDIARPIFILAWIIGIHFIEANLLNPKIIGSAAKMHPVLVIFALVLGEHSYGLTGALLAVPTASVIQVIFMYFRRKTWKTETGAFPIVTKDELESERPSE